MILMDCGSSPYYVMKFRISEDSMTVSLQLVAHSKVPTVSSERITSPSGLSSWLPVDVMAVHLIFAATTASRVVNASHVNCIH